MHPLSATELLGVWERGVTMRPVERGLALLAVASSDEPPEALTNACIGECDARLLTLREWTFGSHLVGLTKCPDCSEQLEVDFDVAQIRAPVGEPTSEFSVTVSGYEVTFRLPSGVDVAAVADEKDVATARQRLLERCLRTAQYLGESCAASDLPAEVVNAVSAHMGEADPQGDVWLAISCPACCHVWEAGFNIASFFWSEVDAWAQRTLRDVHILASVYGWRESDILALHPRRRQMYLEMARG